MRVPSACGGPTDARQDRLDAFNEAVQTDPALVSVAADWLREQELPDEEVVVLFIRGQLPVCVAEAYFGPESWRELMDVAVAATVRVVSDAFALVPPVFVAAGRAAARGPPGPPQCAH